MQPVGPCRLDLSLPNIIVSPLWTLPFLLSPTDHQTSLHSLPAICHLPCISESAALCPQQGHQRLRRWVRRNSFFSPALPGFTTWQLGRARRLPGHVSGGWLSTARGLFPGPAADPELPQCAPPAALAPPRGAPAPSPTPSSRQRHLSPRHISSHRGLLPLPGVSTTAVSSHPSATAS